MADGHAEEEGDGGGNRHGDGGDPQRDRPGRPGRPGGEAGEAGEVERRRRLVERLGDPVPHPFGRPLAAVGEEGGGLPVPLDLGPAAGAAGQVGLDHVALVVVDGVEGEGSEELLDVVVGEAAAHGAPPIPASTRTVRKRRRPERMRLLTVPSGSSSRLATSR